MGMRVLRTAYNCLRRATVRPLRTAVRTEVLQVSKGLPEQVAQNKSAPVAPFLTWAVYAICMVADHDCGHSMREAAVEWLSDMFRWMTGW